MNADGHYEDAYVWQGVGDPQYFSVFPCRCAPCFFAPCGGFAECYTGPAGGGHVNGIELAVTTMTNPGTKNPPDVYVWRDAGGKPGTIIQYIPRSSFAPFSVSPFPNVNLVALCFPTPVAVPAGSFWIGYKDYPGDFMICADLDGFGGCPLTYISPSVKTSPPGWQSVSIVWGPTQSLGIGAWVGP